MYRCGPDLFLGMLSLYSASDKTNVPEEPEAGEDCSLAKGLLSFPCMPLFKHSASFMILKDCHVS